MAGSSEDARAAAGVAARAAGVHLREIDRLDELAEITRLYGQIWQPAGGLPVTVELLVGLAKAGSYVVGAFDGPPDTEKLAGACIGFFGPPAEHSLHSHIAAVAPAVLGRRVGFALKLHQRAWALEHGVDEVLWTFDPLVSRNAYFNVAKLVAEPVEYLVNFYGVMDDGVNGTDDSDRLLVRWVLRAPRGRGDVLGSAVARPHARGSGGGARRGRDRRTTGRTLGRADRARRGAAGHRGPAGQ